MIHAQSCRHRLQFALAIHDTSGTDVIALRKKQLNHHFAVFVQPLRFGLNHHAFGNLGNTGGQKSGITFHLNQAKPATATVGQTVQATKGRNIDSGILSGGQDTLGWESADHFIVNGKGDNL
jgi:hypothetical protein